MKVHAGYVLLLFGFLTYQLLGFSPREQPSQNSHLARIFHHYGVPPCALAQSLKHARQPRKTTQSFLLWPQLDRAYPLVEVKKAGGRVQETFAGLPVTVQLDPDSQAFDAEAPSPIEVIEGFWFAWVAFHPGTSVFVAP